MILERGENDSALLCTAKADKADKDLLVAEPGPQHNRSCHPSQELNNHSADRKCTQISLMACRSSSDTTTRLVGDLNPSITD